MFQKTIDVNVIRESTAGFNESTVVMDFIFYPSFDLIFFTRISFKDSMTLYVQRSLGVIIYF